MPDYTNEYTFWVLIAAAVAVGMVLGMVFSMQIFRDSFKRVKEGLAREQRYKKDLFEQGRELADAAHEVREAKKDMLKVIVALAVVTKAGGQQKAPDGGTYVAIDLPTGQVSWLFSEGFEYLIDPLAQYTKPIEELNETKRSMRLVFLPAYFIEDPEERRQAVEMMTSILSDFDKAEQKHAAAKAA